MDVSILQICLISFWYCFANISWPFGSMGQWATLNRPLVSGLVVGLILGDPVQGTIIGATINIMYLGIISAGGSLPSDSGMAGIMGTAFAIIGGLDTGAALALAVPMGLVGSVLNVLTMAGQCFLIPLADKWIDEGKSNRIMLINMWIPYIVKTVIRFVIAFVILYFGANALDSIVNALSGPVMDALSLMGGLLPAVGVGLMLLTIFKGRARKFSNNFSMGGVSGLAVILAPLSPFPWLTASAINGIINILFLFLGFAATSYLNLGTIAVAFIFGIIAVLVVGFDADDLSAFRSVKGENAMTYRYFSKGDLTRAWLRWHWFCESCYNYERMQGLGFCNAMVPLLNKIYKGDKEGLVAAMKRHAMFFNTDHNFGGMILGICASMEEQKKAGADIPDEAFVSLKSGLMGPCAGIGDTLSQVVLLPILSVIFINLASQGAVWAPVAFTIIFMAIFYGVGYWMLKLGYNSGGETVLKLMESGLFDKVIEVASILGCAVMGALVCSFVTFNWNVSIVQEGVELFNLQTGVFDAILPNAMPLLLTMGVYGMAKKGVKSSYITFAVMGLGFVLGVLGLIA